MTPRPAKNGSFGEPRARPEACRAARPDLQPTSAGSSFLCVSCSVSPCKF